MRPAAAVLLFLTLGTLQRQAAAAVPDESFRSEFTADGFAAAILAEAGVERLHLTLHAPDGVWCAIGCAADAMNNTYAVGIHANGTLLERVLGPVDAGRRVRRDATLTSVSVDRGIRKAVITVPVAPYDLSRDRPFPFIWARGSDDAPEFGYHGDVNRGAAVFEYEHMSAGAYRHIHIALGGAAWAIVIPAAMLARVYGPARCGLERSGPYLHAFLLTFGYCLCGLAIFIADQQSMHAREHVHAALAWPLVGAMGVYAVVALVDDFRPGDREEGAPGPLGVAAAGLAALTFLFATVTCGFGVAALVEQEQPSAGWCVGWALLVGLPFAVVIAVAARLQYTAMHRAGTTSPRHRRGYGAIYSA